MKITKIQIMNFLGLSAFMADNLGKLNRLTGDNGVGKSSVLKAIQEAFKSSGVDATLIKTNSDKAEIMIELDEARILIERQITPSSNNVKVIQEGQPVGSPQKFLNSLLGLGSNFSPIDFFTPKPPKGMTPERYRRELLLSAMPIQLKKELITELIKNNPEFNWEMIDYSKHGLEVLAEMQRDVYDRRHEVGLDVTRQKKAIEQDTLDLPATTSPTLNCADYESFDLQSTVNELALRKSVIQAHDQDVSALAILRDQAASKVTEIERLGDLLKNAEAEMESINQQGHNLKNQIEAFIAPEIESLQTLIDNYQAHQRLALRLEDIERRKGLLEVSNTAYESLDNLHRALTHDIPKKVLSDIKLPIEGMEIASDQIKVKGVAIDNLSNSEKIKLALAIARALAGELKVICIDGFESLDAKQRQAFEAVVRECGDDFEYFYTIVNQDPSADGSLKLEIE